MARRKTFTEQIVIRVDEDTLRRLEADAEAHGRTVAQSVRYLLRQALDNDQGGQGG